MKKTFKAGERFNSFQKKKKAHSEADMGKMPKYSQLVSKTNAPDTKMPNARAVAKPQTVSPIKLVGGVGNFNGSKPSPNSTIAMKLKKKHSKKKKSFNTTTKKTGKFEGKSNALGHGGRAAQLKARGVPGGVIGNMARAAHAAPGQANYHGKKHKKMSTTKHCKTCSC